MDSFENKIAVVTGGGTGMGRALTLALVSQGCEVAICDVSEDNMQETAQLAEAAGTSKVSTYVCDVSSEAEVNAFQAYVANHHGATIHLLFNNAGIGGGGGFVAGSRDEWERTFAVCWYGVYYGCRAFLPMLRAAVEAHIVNTSSVNGFWASIGPTTPHTAYAAAKFAVKGFTEALITDLRINAPHINVSVVMPGHIGTSIAINSRKVLGHSDALNMTEQEVKDLRERLMHQQVDEAAHLMNLSDDQLREMVHQQGLQFRDQAPTSADQAADVILKGVKDNQWRILVGDDAHQLDARVRANPWDVYEHDFRALTSITEAN